MKHHGTGAPRYVVLLLGGVFVPGLAIATEVDPLALQAPAATAPALIHAKLWQAGHDPTGYWVS